MAEFNLVHYTDKFTVLHQKEILRIDRDAFGKTGNVWLLDNFIKKLPFKKELSFYLINVKTNAVVGLLIGTSSSESCTHINRIAVDKKFQGKGLGKRLMNSFLLTSKKLGFTETTITTTYKKDTEYLLRFYETLGYSILRSKKSILSFLKFKNKVNELDLFYPPCIEGKLIIMLKYI